MRVQSVRKEIDAAGSEQERTGIFATSIISKVDQRQIALFFTGQKHAGENLNQLLQRRAAGLDQPMQMCDAFSRNEPKEFHTLLCHCLLHGRRQFVGVVESFSQAQPLPREELCLTAGDDENRRAALPRRPFFRPGDREKFGRSSSSALPKITGHS
jgi:hypothetical protein